MMTLRLPSTIRGIVCDLEGTLVDYPVTEEIQPDYIALPGTNLFLGRCQQNLGSKSILIFTTASFERCFNAYSRALDAHSALGFGLWVTQIPKVFKPQFNSAASQACELMQCDKTKLAYIDNSPRVCLNALLYGFGFVLSLCNEEQLSAEFAHFTELEHIEIQRRIDAEEFEIASNISEVYF